jgi:UDP-GlcNAc:undecaprenyl-phosphate GlcNAc-1-phosphate transferase
MSLLILFGVFVLVISITPVIIRLALKTGKLDYPSIRKIHKDPTPSIGGHVFIPIAFIGWWLMVDEFDIKVVSLTLSSVILYLMGVIDDIHNLSYKIKLPIQVAASLIVIYSWNLLPLDFGGPFGIQHVHSWWGLILIVAFFQFAINAINYTDGINGLLGSFAIVSFGFLAWFTLGGAYPHMTPLLLNVAAGIMGFLFFNFRTTALTFMGDTGSTVIGLIAAMATTRVIGNQPHIELFNGVQIPSFFMLVVVFWYPFFDSLQVYVRRLLRGNSPFLADRSHIHHTLLVVLKKRHLLVTSIIVGVHVLLLGLVVVILK